MNCISAESLYDLVTDPVSDDETGERSPVKPSGPAVLEKEDRLSPDIESDLTYTPVMAPAQLQRFLPLSGAAARTVATGRETIRNILDGKDRRLLVITGPCSLHDERSALAYAEKLRRLQAEVGNTIFLVMRTYIEKPRTHIGWKGMFTDPHLNGTCDMSGGLRRVRSILLRINEMGVPVATEILSPVSPAYLADLVSWAAIGARTAESQTHREMTSGLPMPVGFKNGTDGGVSTAMNAVRAARHSHSFPGIDSRGRVGILRTEGNPRGHIVLRGGRKPNYDAVSVRAVQSRLRDENLPGAVVIDCSHGNSGKDHRRQGHVFRDVLAQRLSGNRHIAGLMLESHLHPGRQNLAEDLSRLRYGVSVTDACIGWAETESLIREADRRLRSD